MGQMRLGKAAGPDNIPADLIIHGGVYLKARLHTLILYMWEAKYALGDLKNALIITIFRKGDRRLW